MAYNNPLYSITYRDAQDRENIVYIDPDNGYAGAATALTPDESPVVYRFGASGDDEYRSLNPTELVLRVKVDSNALFAAIVAQQSLYWRVRWLRGGSEVWRGYLITDEIQQPFDLPSILTMRAICGLKELDGIEWTPTTSGAATVITHVEDAIDELNGSLLDIGYYANWHGRTASETTTTAVSGNSYSVYSFDGTAFQDPYDATKKSVCSLVVQQGVGVFGGKICMADGKWRIYQRDALAAASYTMDLFATGTEAISAYTLTDDEIYSGAILSHAPAYYKVIIGYNHFPEEAGMLLNGDFTAWSGSPETPDSWTEVGGSGILTKVPFNSSRIPGLIPLNDGYVCAITDRPHTGSDYGSDAVSNATYGIYQDTAFDARSTLHKIALSFSARHIGNDDDALLFFYSIWQDGDAGTDYYWDAAAKAWTAASVGNTLLSPGAASKMPRSASSSWFDYSVETDNLPDSGPLRVYLWTVVDKSGTTSAIWFDKVRLSYLTGDRSERVRTIAESLNAEQTSGLVRSEEIFFIGDGPSDNHDGALTKSGEFVTDWKAGAYANPEANSGLTLEKLHAQQIMDARGGRPQRIVATFRPDSGSYWPHMALRYDYAQGSSYKYYSCVYLSYDSGYDEYTGEWVEVAASGVSQTLTEEYSDEDIRPGDIIRPFDGGKVQINLSDRPFSGFTLAGGTGRGDRFFPRSNSVSTDPTVTLRNNYITGTLELASGSSIRFPGTDSSTAGTYITDQLLRVRAGANTVSEMTASGGTGTMRTVSSSGGFTFQTTGTGFVEKSGDGQLVFNKAGGPSGHSLGTTTSSVDLTLFANDAPASYYIKFDASAGDILVQPAAAGGGKIKLSGAYWPNTGASSGTGGQILYSDGAGNLAFTTDTPTDGQVLTWNTGGTLSWETSASGVTTFLGLTDTPSSFSGTGTYFVKVNAGATALEFVANPGYLTSAVTSVAAGIGLDGGTITSTGTISLSTTLGTADAWPTTLIGFDGDVDYVGIAISSFGSTLIDDTSASAARSTLGLGSLATLSSINDSNWSGTDLAVANGGTGASTAANARINLGVAIGTNVQAYDAGLTSIANLTTAADRMIYTTASDTYAVATLTSFARTLLDDADAATARGTLGVDPAGTDNSTNVSLAGAYDYLTIVGQVITRGQIDLTTDVTGVLPSGNIGSHVHAASDITSGTLADARVAQSNVTQHQAALSIAWGQLTSVPSTFTPSAHTLDSHSNVTITSNTSGEILKWNGTAWVNNTLAEAGIAAASHTHAATDITSGTIASARISGSYTGITGTGALSAGSITTGFGTIATANTISTTSKIYVGGSTFATDGIQLDYNGGNPRFYVGDGASSYFQFDGTTAKLNGGLVTSIAGGSEVAIQGWQATMAFSATDADTVAWGAGTLTLMDGTSYSIGAGNTGNMAAKTYIYFSTASPTALLTTTTASTAIGSGKIIVAVAQNTTTEAKFQVFGGSGGLLVTADEIAANSITANEIASNTITANEIAASTITGAKIAAGTITASNLSVTSLDAITATMGNLTINGTLQTSGYGAGAGVQITTTKMEVAASATTLCKMDAGIVTATSSSGTSTLTSLGLTTDSVTVGDKLVLARWASPSGTALSSTLYADSSDVLKVYKGTAGPYTVWHSGNDGAGSGLDADTVDGVQLSGLLQTGAIGSTVQAYDAHLEDLAALSAVSTAEKIMMSSGAGTWAYYDGVFVEASALNATAGTRGPKFVGSGIYGSGGNPGTETFSGWLYVRVGGTVYRVPLYADGA